MHFQHTIEILQTWFIFSIPRKLKKTKKKNTNHLNWPKMPILRWFSCSQENKLFCRQKNKTKPNNNFSPCSNDAHYLDCLFCLCLSCVQPNADKLLLFCFSSQKRYLDDYQSESVISADLQVLDTYMSFSGEVSLFVSGNYKK